MRNNPARQEFAPSTLHSDHAVPPVDLYGAAVLVTPDLDATARWFVLDDLVGLAPRLADGFVGRAGLRFAGAGTSGLDCPLAYGGGWCSAHWRGHWLGRRLGGGRGVRRRCAKRVERAREILIDRDAVLARASVDVAVDIRGVQRQRQAEESARHHRDRLSASLSTIGGEAPGLRRSSRGARMRCGLTTLAVACVAM